MLLQMQYTFTKDFYFLDMNEEEQNNIKQGQDEDNPALSEPGLKPNTLSQKSQGNRCHLERGKTIPNFEL